MLAALLIGSEPTNDEKLGWGVDECNAIAAETGYDACIVVLESNSVDMRLIYSCAVWDEENNRLIYGEDLTVHYLWTDDGLQQLDNPIMGGCPDMI